MDRKAQDYIINQFKKAGILPGANNNSYQQIFKLENGNKTANLIGYLPGNDPKLKNELIIVSGHYDHLGMKNGKMYPGANDNASGTAAIVELAYAFGKLILFCHIGKRLYQSLSSSWQETAMEAA